MLNKLRRVKKAYILRKMSRGQSLRFLLLCFVLALLLQALHIPSALAASALQGATREQFRSARETSPTLVGQKHIPEVSARPMDCTTNFTLDCLVIVLHIPTGTGSVQNPIAPEFTLLFFTPLDITADNTQVINIWNASLTIVNIFVVVVLVFHGINLIVSGTVFRYAQAIETIPGVLLALVAANCSLVFIRFFLGLNGIFCIDIYTWASSVQNIPDKGLLDALQIVPKDLNFDNLSLQDIINNFGNVMPLIKDVLSAMLLGQIVIRLFFFVVYIVLAPIGLACWGLPGKAGQSMTRLWFTGFTSTVMSQSVQVLAIIVVEFSLGPILRIFTVQISGNLIDPGLLNDVVHIAFLWFIIQVTGIFESAPARAIVEIGGAISEATGAIIGSQFALQQIMGDSFVSVASLSVSTGTRSLRRRLTPERDSASEHAPTSQRRGTGTGASVRGSSIGSRDRDRDRDRPLRRAAPETQPNSLPTQGSRAEVGVGAQAVAERATVSAKEEASSGVASSSVHPESRTTTSGTTTSRKPAPAAPDSDRKSRKASRKGHEDNEEASKAGDKVKDFLQEVEENTYQEWEAADNE
jgi:hypothetical protein